MKCVFTIFLAVFAVVQLFAATNEAPVKLAIIFESPEAGAAADVLTVEFTKDESVQLLERSEIEKIYNEQALSAGNRDYVKVGQILGADGVLLLNVLNEPLPANAPAFGPPKKNLTVRMIAVKPGVVLMDGTMQWPVKDMTQWSGPLVEHLNLLLPKLTVLAKDALPLSVVNFRSAIQSDEAKVTEQELKSLTIQRLSREQQLFVLERERMQSLGEEKVLNSDESAFWNGSYLLEGVIDKNGYSKDTMTIDARLTPPKGGEPLLFQVSGSRTNLAEMVNRLVVKVAELLKVNSATKEWNAADEAARYFGEAQWALRWKMYSEAQMSADSAWALGKKDLDCAVLQIKAYVQELSANTGHYQRGDNSLACTFDVNNHPLGPTPSDAAVEKLADQLTGKHKVVKITKITTRPGVREVAYVFSDEVPVAENIDHALHALRLYQEFSRTSPTGEPKILYRGKGWNDWHNSEWYQTGIDDLTAASKVLQSFNLAPEAESSVADKLAELRALARSVAGEISSAPSVHDSYFVGNRVANHDELSHTMEEHDSIFRCETDWGSYWQEKPEDCLALYRELLASPVFCYLHHDWWDPNPPAARLAAWNIEDQKRIPEVWQGFVQELSDSTNVLWQMEAKALAQADATNDDQAKAAAAGWWSLVRSHRQELVANNVELFYLGWGFADNPETEAMDQEYWQKTIPAREMANTFDKQKHYLASFTPYDWNEFNGIFESRDFTQAQAAELKPLIAAYESNLLAQVPTTATSAEQFKAKNNVQWIGFYLDRQINAALHPPAPVAQPAISSSPQPAPKVISPPPLAMQSKTPALTSAPAPEPATHVLTVTKFLPIPLAGLPGDQISDVTITAHHFLEGKLLLDFQYSAFLYSYDANTNWTGTRGVTLPAIAILDLKTERWTVISCPEASIEAQSRFYHRSTLWHGGVFSSNGDQIRRYDSKVGQWQVLACSSGDNCELFTIHDHLYAANANVIFEIMDEEGKATRILASTRRQPAASMLDTEDLGTPALFAGPDNSLRVSTLKNIFTWTGQDWREVAAAPQAPMPPTISSDGVLFFADGWNAPAGIWRLATESDQVEFCLGQGAGPRMGNPGKYSKPAWKLPPEFSLPRLPAVSHGQDLYLLADHARSQDVVDEQRHAIVGKKVFPQDGYHAVLICFAGNYSAPQKVPLKFEAENAVPPVTGDGHATGFALPGIPAAWLMFSSNYLYFGRESYDALPSAAGAYYINGPQAGVWMISLEQIDREIARQKIAQQQQQVRSDALAGQATQALILKYDRNHNGVIDGDEREEAMDDPDFIKSKLDEIDANHNGWLDAPELAWFDANQNKILEPKEQAGIILAEQFLSERLFRQYDQAGKGWLNQREYDEMIQAGLQINPNADLELQFASADTNHDRHIDLGELQRLMLRRLERGLWIRGARMPGMFFPGAPGFPQSPGSGQGFKAKLEAYWQHPAGVSNPSPAGNRTDNPP